MSINLAQSKLRSMLPNKSITETLNKKITDSIGRKVLYYDLCFILVAPVV